MQLLRIVSVCSELLKNNMLHHMLEGVESALSEAAELSVWEHIDT